MVSTNISMTLIDDGQEVRYSGYIILTFSKLFINRAQNSAQNKENGNHVATEPVKVEQLS